MNGGVFILVIAGGLVLAYVCIFVITPLFAHLLYKVAEAGARVGYSRRARKQNEKARLLRLERTEYDGWPLPSGKHGEIRITEAMQIAMPAKSYKDINHIYGDRARDLEVDVSVLQESNTHDLVIQWHPSKRQKHRKAHYSRPSDSK